MCGVHCRKLWFTCVSNFWSISTITQSFPLIFTSWRSLPRVMMLDNATTFIAAGEELQSLLSSAALADNLTRRGVEWCVIPKHAHWFSGLWERLIGLTKSALKRVLGCTHATLEILQTLVAKKKHSRVKSLTISRCAALDTTERCTPSVHRHYYVHRGHQ